MKSMCECVCSSVEFVLDVPAASEFVHLTDNGIVDGGAIWPNASEIEQKYSNNIENARFLASYVINRKSTIYVIEAESIVQSNA